MCNDRWGGAIALARWGPAERDRSSPAVVDRAGRAGQTRPTAFGLNPGKMSVVESTPCRPFSTSETMLR